VLCGHLAEEKIRQSAIWPIAVARTGCP
jgi:hypothetical protein